MFSTIPPWVLLIFILLSMVFRIFSSFPQVFSDHCWPEFSGTVPISQIHVAFVNQNSPCLNAFMIHFNQHQLGFLNNGSLRVKWLLSQFIIIILWPYVCSILNTHLRKSTKMVYQISYTWFEKIHIRNLQITWVKAQNVS